MFTSEQETKNITWTTEYLTRIQEVNVVFFYFEKWWRARWYKVDIGEGVSVL